MTNDLFLFCQSIAQQTKRQTQVRVHTAKESKASSVNKDADLEGLRRSCAESVVSTACLTSSLIQVL